MTMLPHDLQDLYLAPVVLSLDARIAELGRLEGKELVTAIALESDCPDWTRGLREEAVLRAVGHRTELHGWELQWDERGIRLTHGDHAVVLGVSPSLTAYVDGLVTHASTDTTG